MIKLAICDDEISFLVYFRTLLAQYTAQREHNIECVDFHSPLDLLAQIERGVRFDVLFLDVLLPGETGIRAAAEIRKYDSNVKIIFLTSSADYAVESYGVEAFYYQLKPLWRDRFFSLMDSVVSSCEKERANGVILRCKSGITRVDLKRLEYCEVIHHTLFIHLTDGKVLECTGSLEEMSKQLVPYDGFCRPHRSYLVNLEHIDSLSYKSMLMHSGAEIPIPRGKFQELRATYLEYAFRNRRVMI